MFACIFIHEKEDSFQNQFDVLLVVQPYQNAKSLAVFYHITSLQTAHVYHSKVFIRTVHLKCSNLKNKAISNTICN